MSTPIYTIQAIKKLSKENAINLSTLRREREMSTEPWNVSLERDPILQTRARHSFVSECVSSTLNEVASKFSIPKYSTAQANFISDSVDGPSALGCRTVDAHMSVVHSCWPHSFQPPPSYWQTVGTGSKDGITEHDATGRWTAGPVTWSWAFVLKHSSIDSHCSGIRLTAIALKIARMFLTHSLLWRLLIREQSGGALHRFCAWL